MYSCVHTCRQQNPPLNVVYQINTSWAKSKPRWAPGDGRGGATKVSRINEGKLQGRKGKGQGRQQKKRERRKNEASDRTKPTGMEQRARRRTRDRKRARDGG